VIKNARISGFVASVAVLALAAAPALADGVDAALDSGGLLITVSTEAANVHFSYHLSCADNAPCYEINAGVGPTGTPVTAGGGCKAQMGNELTPSVIQCPVAGINAITFVFKNGGTWAAYEGGGGQHAAGPCSPVPVTVETGPGPMTSVDSWDGCPETVICNGSGSAFTGAEVDAADTLRGTCSSVVRH
jgi:hypothetical protein